jgi:hypothetical protein
MTAETKITFFMVYAAMACKVMARVSLTIPTFKEGFEACSVEQTIYQRPPHRKNAGFLFLITQNQNCFRMRIRKIVAEQIAT